MVLVEISADIRSEKFDITKVERVLKEILNRDIDIALEEEVGEGCWTCFVFWHGEEIARGGVCFRKEEKIIDVDLTMEVDEDRESLREKLIRIDDLAEEIIYNKYSHVDVELARKIREIVEEILRGA